MFSFSEMYVHFSEDFKACSFTFKIYSIATMRTLTWKGIQFGSFILIVAIHYLNQPIENSMSSSHLGCDFVTSLFLLSERLLACDFFRLMLTHLKLCVLFFHFQDGNKLSEPFHDLQFVRQQVTSFIIF